MATPITWEPGTTMYALHKMVRDHKEAGTLLMAIDITYDELKSLRWELTVATETDYYEGFVPASLFGVPMRIEGMTAEQWKALRFRSCRGAVRCRFSFAFHSSDTRHGCGYPAPDELSSLSR